jgi:drug/metabolite transporter (DMT)-like permease
VRLALASTLFLAAIAIASPRAAPPWSRADRLRLIALAIVGHTVYQLLFISALARTSVANSALIIGCTPIFVALMTAALGDERVTPWQWAGTFLSALGIYIVVGGVGAVTRGTLRGDLTMLAAVLCWSAATVGARPLLARHSPLAVTGYSMAIGTALYLVYASPRIAAVDWRAVSAHARWAIVLSAVFALCIAYMIWYTALQRVGNTRTAVYSNTVPIAGMVVAWAALGEQIPVYKIVGAALILCGVALTKVQSDGIVERSAAGVEA